MVKLYLEVLVLPSYQKTYTKALGKDGILVHHEQNVMHQHATERADCFKLTFIAPDVRVDCKSETRTRRRKQRNSMSHCLLYLRYYSNRDWKQVM